MTLVLAVDQWVQLDGDERIIHKKGDVLNNIDSADRERLLRIGAAHDSDTTPAAATPKKEKVTTPAAKTPAENSGETPTINFPKNAAKIDIWRAFGEKNGVDTKGLTKAEIRAAVEAKIAR